MPDAHDFTGLTATFVNCTLKRSPEPSHTQGLVDASAAIMSKHGVEVHQLRLIAHDVATGAVSKDWKVADLRKAYVDEFLARSKHRPRAEADALLQPVVDVVLIGLHRMPVVDGPPDERERRIDQREAQRKDGDREEDRVVAGRRRLQRERREAEADEQRA